MNVSPITTVFTLLGGLLLAGVLAWIRRARLTVLVPRLFTHSLLTSRGQLAEISVFNRGFKTEEAVELSLNPNLRYELVGANSSDASLANGKLNISRVGPGDEVTALLLVEGGTFSKADIVSCLSKETKGEVVAKLEQVVPTGPQRIGLVAFFVVVPLTFYAMTFVIDYLIEKTPLATSVASQEKKEAKQTLEVQGWTVPSLYERASGSLFREFAAQKIQVSFLQVARKKDLVTVSVLVANHTSAPITYTLSISAAGSQDRVPFEDRRKSNVLVMPQGRSEARIGAIISASVASQSEKSVYVECFLESTQGDSLKLNRLLVAE